MADCYLSSSAQSGKAGMDELAESCCGIHFNARGSGFSSPPIPTAGQAQGVAVRGGVEYWPAQSHGVFVPPG